MSKLDKYMEALAEQDVDEQLGLDLNDKIVIQQCLEVVLDQFDKGRDPFKLMPDFIDDMRKIVAKLAMETHA